MNIQQALTEVIRGFLNGSNIQNVQSKLGQVGAANSKRM